MKKYRVIADVVTSAYLGDIEVEDEATGEDIRAAERTFMGHYKNKRVSKQDLDDDFYVDDVAELELIEPGEPEYEPVRCKLQPTLFG